MTTTVITCRLASINFAGQILFHLFDEEEHLQIIINSKYIVCVEYFGFSNMDHFQTAPEEFSGKKQRKATTLKWNMGWNVPML